MWIRNTTRRSDPAAHAIRDILDCAISSDDAPAFCETQRPFPTNTLVAALGDRRLFKKGSDFVSGNCSLRQRNFKFAKNLSLGGHPNRPLMDT